jgi:hypothetical protein
MGPPASSSAKTMPARGSVGSAFVASTKATEDLKAKIAGLEMQLAEKVKEREQRTVEAQKEREMMVKRYVSVRIPSSPLAMMTRLRL